MFGKEKRKSRLERENDDLEEQIYILKSENDYLRDLNTEIELKYFRNLREYRYSQKANCKYKRSNRRLRKMLDDVGWPKNDKNPAWIKVAPAKVGERLISRKLP